ncbi:MAG: copper resistance protein CopC, partial [Mesorhizobium sp.]
MSAASILRTVCTTGRLAIGLAAAIVLLAAIAAPSQAFAHAALVTTDPEDGAVLAQSS